MTRVVDALRDIAPRYDVIVFDQWGVLHNGITPYAGAVPCLNALRQEGYKIAVLSNSGKRTQPNATRIAGMGFGPEIFDFVMTSGEALWRDVKQKSISARRFLPVERAPGDAAQWAVGLSIELVGRAEEADAILLMGLPDGAVLADWQDAMRDWFARGLSIYCSNPDRQSPRADGVVISPGALAFAYRAMGGATYFYGKPHRPVFSALEQIFGDGRYLMVGDSLEHDIAGAHGAGWDSLLIEGGLYADAFATGNAEATLAALVADKHTQPPTYRMEHIR